MYELIQVSGNSYYIQSPAKIGLYRLSDSEVCLIDSGNDKDAGRKIKKVLESQVRFKDFLLLIRVIVYGCISSRFAFIFNNNKIPPCILGFS